MKTKRYKRFWAAADDGDVNVYDIGVSARSIEALKPKIEKWRKTKAPQYTGNVHINQRVKYWDAADHEWVVDFETVETV